jgi:hypothetical protein
MRRPTRARSWVDEYRPAQSELAHDGVAGRL